MKGVAIAIMVCVFLAGWSIPEYCQAESTDDTAIEQSESQISQDLGSEISSDQSQAEGEVGQVDASMNTSGSY